MAIVYKRRKGNTAAASSHRKRARGAWGAGGRLGPQKEARK